MSQQLIQLAIADDHLAFRQCLKIALSQYPFISISTEAESGIDLIHKLSFSEPDVLLLDLKMPGMNAMEVLKRINEDFPSIRTLVLSAYMDEVYVAECINCGINGYLTKDMEINEIVSAIISASRNEVFYTNLLGNSLLKKYVTQYQKHQQPLLPYFSCEERKIAELLKDELTTEEISRHLHLSKRSIETKREKMKAKANAKTTAGLLLYCLKRGLIE